MARQNAYGVGFSICILIIGAVWLGYQHFHNEQVQTERLNAYKSCVSQEQAYYQPIAQYDLANPLNGGLSASTQTMQQEQAAISQCPQQ